MNRRIQVSLSDLDFERVHRLASLRQVSMSSIVRELVEINSDTLDALGHFFENAGSLDLLSDEGKKKIVAEIVAGEKYAQNLSDRASYDLRHVLQEVQNLVDTELDDEAIARARSASNLGSRPPFINKGAKKASKGGQKPSDTDGDQG